MNGLLKNNIYWVGVIDWNVRDFHGYQTDRGSTYNAYLVLDEQPALIDTVKAPFVAQLLANVAELTDLSKIRYVVCNHAEPDHAGGLLAVMAACPQAELVCDRKCRDTLALYMNTAGWKFRIVADGETLALGKRTLQFLETPMVHWPESMFTYVPEEKLLFSMDAFGQHYACARRFDDENQLDVVMAEAKIYYANILMPYGKPIARVLDRAQALALEMLATSHGVIWRTHLAKIVAAYRDWTVCKPSPKVLVLYDTMWNSTGQMAQAILEGALTVPGIDAKLINIRASNPTVIASEALDTAGLAVGSPTLNSTLMPQMAAVLTYLKGLRPANKLGLAFGSYGWAKGGAEAVNDYLKAINIAVLREPIQAQYGPTLAILAECRASGRQLAQEALKKVDSAP